MIFPLFELAKIINFRSENPTKERSDVHITSCAWKEVGDMSQLALLLSNGFLVFRYCVGGHKPVTRQLPWYQGHPIKHMCFDTTATWLLCLTKDCSLFIIPVLTLLDHKARVNRLWRIDDVTHVRLNKKGSPSCVAWWHTLNDQHIAIVGMESGKILLVNLVTENIVIQTDINGNISSIDIIQDDRQSTTYALITTCSGGQWKLMLEHRTTVSRPLSDREIGEMGYEQIDSRQAPLDTILYTTEENQQEFLPRRFYQFSSLSHMTPQYAKGRHFVGVHDTTKQSFEIFDSNIEHSPLFIYSVPEQSTQIIFCDKLTFTVSRNPNDHLKLQSNQLAETSVQNQFVFNPGAIVQQFGLPITGEVVGMYKRYFPFYWHEKKEEEYIAKIMAEAKEKEQQIKAANEAIESIQTLSWTSSEQHKVSVTPGVVCRDQNSSQQQSGSVIQSLLKAANAELQIDTVPYQSDNTVQSKSHYDTNRNNVPVATSLEESTSIKLESLSTNTDEDKLKQKDNISKNIKLSQPVAADNTVPTTVKLGGAFNIPISTHTVLDGCILVTENTVYECRPRVSPERLFLELALQPSDVAQAEQLGIMLGLDIIALYEMAAKHVLKQGDYVHAVRLFQLSKCPHVRRVNAFAKCGRISEVMTYLQQALQNRQEELTFNDKKQMSNMAVHCFVHQILERGKDDKQLCAQFREFLLSSFSYDEKTAIKLLAEYNMSDLLFEVAKARGFVLEAVELLVSRGQYDIEGQQIKGLVARGFAQQIARIADGAILRCMTTSDMVHFLLSRPNLALQYMNMLRQAFSSLDENKLLEIAHLFDPSKPVMQAYLRKTDRRRHRTGSVSSVNSFSDSFCSSDVMQEDQNRPDLSELVEFFLEVVLSLNKQRGQVHPTFDFLNEKTLQVKEEKKDVSRKKSSSRHYLVCKPVPAGCGQQHAGIVKGNELFMWGSNQFGRLGIGENSMEQNVSTPTRVELFTSLQIRVLSISCGANHTLVVTDQGVFSWGSSTYGQTGLGTRHCYTRPMQVEVLAEKTCVAVVCGQYHSLALMNDSSVYSWGWGVHGQLGHNSAEDELIPRCIQSVQDLLVTKIDAGYSHSLIATAKGDAYAFGCGLFGQLGLGSTVKMTIPKKMDFFMEPVLHIATKYFHSVAVTISNKVYTWGCSPLMLRQTAHVIRKSRSRSHSNPHRARSCPEFDSHLEPKLVDTDDVQDKIVQITCGSTHSGLVTLSGLVYMWGRNSDGQLGIGHRQDKKCAVQVPFGEHQNVEFLNCGMNYTVAMDTTGQVYSWGRNDKGQLGLPQIGHQLRVSQAKERDIMMDKLRPTPIPLFKPVAKDTRRSSRQRPYRPRSNSAESDYLDDSYDTEPEAVPLPNLSIIGQKPYGSAIITTVVKYIPQHVNMIKLTRQCIDYGDFNTAAEVYQVQGLYPQAFYYMLKELNEYKTQMVESDDTFLHTALAITEYCIKACAQQHVNEIRRNNSLENLLKQAFQFWQRHKLPVNDLEEMFIIHLDVLACTLSLLLFRKVGTSQYNDGEISTWGISNKFQAKFSTSFCLKVTSAVMHQIDTDSSQSTNQAYDSYLLNMDINLQSIDVGEHSVPQEKLWQEIIQNLRKDLLLRDHITLSSAEINALKTASVKESGITEDEDNSEAANKVVVFTCGHHYTKKVFLEEIVPSFTESMSKGINSLPNTANLLTQYYRREGNIPMACPKCVLNAI